MHIQIFPTAKQALSLASEQLKANEDRCGMVYATLRRMVESPDALGTVETWICALAEGSEIMALAMRTPPFKVLLAEFSPNHESIVPRLASAVFDLSPDIPGAVGDRHLTEAFVSEWCVRHNQRIERVIPMRLYRLDKVAINPSASGEFRKAKAADADLVSVWANLFHEEVFGHGHKNPQDDFRARVERGEVYLWTDPHPVSMAVKHRPTDRGISIVAVYTPLENRGCGYATACVTRLANTLLTEGYQFVTLYADLLNPVSNSIYRRIGFYEVSDFADFTFAPKPATPSP